MAVAGLGVAAEMGIAVPDDLSLLAWDDSQLCRRTHPTLSAMSHDVHGFGAQVTRDLFAVIAGREVSPLPPAPGPLTDAACVDSRTSFAAELTRSRESALEAAGSPQRARGGLVLARGTNRAAANWRCSTGSLPMAASKVRAAQAPYSGMSRVRAVS